MCEILCFAGCTDWIHALNPAYDEEQENERLFT